MTAIPEHLAGTWQALLRAGYNEGRVCAVLASVTEHGDSMSALSRLKADAGVAAEDDAVERLMLSLGASQALPKVASMAIYERSRQLLENDLRSFEADAPRTPMMRHSDFVRAAKIVTLRRFPAGPMEWELSGIPRSWLLKARPADMLRLATFIARDLNGFQPCFFMHVAPRPRSRALVLEKEVMASYYCMARSLELQPEVLGIVASAWFYDPQAVAENPWLEPLSRPFQNGGRIVLLGPADAASGVLEGNAQRRRKFDEGQIAYRVGLAIWPRARALAWADGHPEYGR